MLLLDQHPDNKSIVVSVLGVPNVGKSSLINCLLGMDLSIVNDRPQTTRNKFHCVFNVDRAEIILVDTPGLHRSGQELNKRLNQQALEGLEGVDLNLLLLDISKPLQAQVQEFMHVLEGRQLGRTWLVLTKADLIPGASSLSFDDFVAKLKEIIPNLERHFIVSSKEEENINLLVGALADAAIPGPHLYPKGEVSNKNMRFFASEYIREQAFSLLKDEVPYELAVVVDDYQEFFSKEDNQQVSKISASILVNRPSQRAIVVGSQGGLIKTIGSQARKKIEAMTGGKVNLNLHVKVSPKWFKNNFVLTEIGLPRSQSSARVWRAK
jgi:GTP-binding protein Era